jgi:hypothetical protein
MSLSRIKRETIDNLFEYRTINDSLSIDLTDKEAREILGNNYLPNHENSIELISIYNDENETGKNYFKLNRCDIALYKYGNDEEREGNNEIFFNNGNRHILDDNFNYIGPTDEPY